MSKGNQYKPAGRPPKPHDKMETKPFNKKIFIGVMALIGLTVVTSIYSLVRSVQNIGSDKNKTQRPQIAGLDIPREVLSRMQRLKNAADRENVIKEWAASEGITFQSKKDGSYVALRDGEEYVIRPADPDYQPPENDEEGASPSEDADETYAEPHEAHTVEEQQN